MIVPVEAAALRKLYETDRKQLAQVVEKYRCHREAIDEELAEAL